MQRTVTNRWDEVIHRHRLRLLLVLASAFLIISQWKIVPSTMDVVKDSYVVAPPIDSRSNHLSSSMSQASPHLLGLKQPPMNSTSHNNNQSSYYSSQEVLLAKKGSALPLWMTNYFDWHTQRLQELTTTTKQQSIIDNNWRKQPLLILRCASNDRCGGTSDRLKSLPLFLVLAAKTQRLLFIRWDRPFALEEFLVPRSPSSFNWSVPSSLLPILDDNNNNDTTTTTNTTPARFYFNGKQIQKLLKTVSNPSVWLVEGNYQYSGTSWYMKLAREWQEEARIVVQDLEYRDVYHDLFQTVFQPSAPVQRLVQHYMQELHLVPNQFVVAHYRAKYPGEPFRKTGNLTSLEERARNAVQCASSLAPGLPVYMASDSVAALETAQRYAAAAAAAAQEPQPKIRIVSHLDLPRTTTPSSSSSWTNHSNTTSSSAAAAAVVDSRLITPPNKEDPAHLNFAKKEDPSAFFGIFVDLIVMSQSRCVSFGAGGFGRFGSLVSFNASCQIPHTVKNRMQTCEPPIR